MLSLALIALVATVADASVARGEVLDSGGRSFRGDLSPDTAGLSDRCPDHISLPSGDMFDDADANSLMETDGLGSGNRTLPSSVLSVPSFGTDQWQDKWWTPARVARVRAAVGRTGISINSTQKERQPPYRIGSSQVDRCGVYATSPINADELIDVVWVPDDSPWWRVFVAQGMAVHITPWFGYGMNHCAGQKTNVRVARHTDGRVWAYSQRDVAAGEELMINYNKVFTDFPFRIFPASPFWKC
jgi:hypothetical protein